MNTNLMFSSATGKWDTPQTLIDDLAPLFPWDLDTCASGPNVCEQYYSEENSAFNHPWYGLCWMNPPYGDPILPCKPNCTRKLCQRRGFHDYDTYTHGIGDWMEKARNEWQETMDQGNLKATIVCLVPARVDTAWWQNHIEYASQVTCIRGRLVFGSDQHWQKLWDTEYIIDPNNPKNKKRNPLYQKYGRKNAAPFPSAFVVFGDLTTPQREKLASYGWTIYH